jgi:hypothetical protein
MEFQSSINVVRALQGMSAFAPRQISLVPPRIAIADEIAHLFDDSMFQVGEPESLGG